MYKQKRLWKNIFHNLSLYYNFSVVEFMSKEPLEFVDGNTYFITVLVIQRYNHPV